MVKGPRSNVLNPDQRHRLLRPPPFLRPLLFLRPVLFLRPPLFFRPPAFFLPPGFGGTLAPARRASLSPIAIACLRLLTSRPEPPDLSVPRLRSCIARFTLLCAFRPYLAIETLREERARHMPQGCASSTTTITPWIWSFPVSGVQVTCTCTALPRR